jgi:hypothetical protein
MFKEIIILIRGTLKEIKLDNKIKLMHDSELRHHAAVIYFRGMLDVMQPSLSMQLPIHRQPRK